MLYREVDGQIDLSVLLNSLLIGIKIGCDLSNMHGFFNTYERRMGRSLPAKERPLTMKRKIGFGTWCFIFDPYDKNPVPFIEVLDKAQELEFDGISLSGEYAGIDEFASKRDRKRLVHMLEARQLGVAEYDANLRDLNPLFQPDTYLARFNNVVQFMADCGFNTVRVDTRAKPVYLVPNDYKRCWKTIVDVFKKASRTAAREKIKLALEFEPGFIFNSASEVLKLYDDVGEENFTLEFDPSHANLMTNYGTMQPGKKEILRGGIVEMIRRMNGKIGMVHLIDNDGTLYKDITSMHIPFGKGEINFDEVLKALRDDAKYTGEWWIVDLVFHPDAWDLLKESKDYLMILNDTYGDY